MAATIHEWSIRVATFADRPDLEELIQASARGLSRTDYSEQQIEAAVASVFGVDSDLIADGTYFVAESNQRPVGCGGWSKRRTLFGGDRFGGRESGWLDPATEFAKIRAFFIHPDFARRGIARALLDHCETESRAAGFHGVELMSTLPGLKLYRACGYVESDPIEYQMPDDTKLELVPMRKELKSGISPQSHRDTEKRNRIS